MSLFEFPLEDMEPHTMLILLRGALEDWCVACPSVRYNCMCASYSPLMCTLWLQWGGDGKEREVQLQVSPRDKSLCVSAGV